MSRVPPEFVAAGDVVIRRWGDGDVVALDEMVTASVEHLRPWMPWAGNEPLTMAQRAETVAGWIAGWDAAEDFTFAITDGADGLLGACGLHRRLEASDGLAIGYWVRVGRTGEGVATAAARALVHAAFCIDGIDLLEIHHDPANAASARVAEKVGFVRVPDRGAGSGAPGEERGDVVWRFRRRP